MTGRAICFRQMFCVVEDDIKALQTGKSFEGCRFLTCMTNGADCVFVIGKLRYVTARARQMTESFGVGELSLRSWHSAQGKRACSAFVCRKAEKSAFGFMTGTGENSGEMAGEEFGRNNFGIIFGL